MVLPSQIATKKALFLLNARQVRDFLINIIGILGVSGEISSTGHSPLFLMGTFLFREFWD
jgi:hypothetical protein